MDEAVVDRILGVASLVDRVVFLLDARAAVPGVVPASNADEGQEESDAHRPASAASRDPPRRWLIPGIAQDPSYVSGVVVAAT